MDNILGTIRLSYFETKMNVSFRARVLEVPWNSLKCARWGSDWRLFIFSARLKQSSYCPLSRFIRFNRCGAYNRLKKKRSVDITEAYFRFSLLSRRIRATRDTCSRDYVKATHRRKLVAMATSPRLHKITVTHRIWDSWMDLFYLFGEGTRHNHFIDTNSLMFIGKS